MEKFRNSLREWGVGKVLLFLSGILFVASYVMKTWFTNTGFVKVLSTSAKVDLVMGVIILVYLFFGQAIHDARKKREREKAQAEAAAKAKEKQEVANAAALAEIQKTLAMQAEALAAQAEEIKNLKKGSK